jgi:ABC-type branched-subunit amino acid transport system substrate-binding protein
MKTPVVGVSAWLDPGSTVHAQTLLRTLTVAIDWTPGVSSLSFVYGNDEATPETAAAVARRFVAEGVDVVIGPFGSGALLGAIDIYEAAGIPVIAPAATIELPRRHANLFRICPSDRLLAAEVARRVRDRGFERVAVLSDDSIHYRTLRDRIHALLDGVATTGTGEPGAEVPDVDAVVYTGRLKPSNAWLKAARGSGMTLPVIMTDDAAAADLLDGVADPGDLEVLGFPTAHQIPGAAVMAARYQRLYGGPPPIYFLEVLAAVETVAQARRSSRPLAQSLSNGTFLTVFGPTRFVDGERSSAALSLWTAGSDGRLQSHSVIEPAGP